MDENQEEKAGNEPDLGAEFRRSFDIGGIQERYMQMAGNQLLNSNPTKGYIEGFENAPEDIKQDASQRLKKAAAIWMDTWEDYLTRGKSIPGDLIGYVATLARKNRETIEKEG